MKGFYIYRKIKTFSKYYFINICVILMKLNYFDHLSIEILIQLRMNSKCYISPWKD